MTEVVRTKVKHISVLTASTLLFLINCQLSFGYLRYGGIQRRQQVDLLQYGSKCSVPRQGGEIVNECDASRGLRCDGRACVCTFEDQFSYDPFSDECRKKLGKSCRVTTSGIELLELPFHQKCHSTAVCSYVGRSLQMESSDPRFSMCICKQGMEPTSQLDGCRTPRPKIQDFSTLRDQHYDYDEGEDR